MSYLRDFLPNVRMEPLLIGSWPQDKTDLTWLDVGGRHRVVFWAALQNAAATGTVGLVVRQAKDALGTGAKDLIDGSEVAQITNTKLVNSATPAMPWVAIEVETARMDSINGFTHLTVAPSTTGTLTGVILAIFHQEPYRPVTQPATCKEIVSFYG